MAYTHCKICIFIITIRSLNVYIVYEKCAINTWNKKHLLTIDVISRFGFVLNISDSKILQLICRKNKISKNDNNRGIITIDQYTISQESMCEFTQSHAHMVNGHSCSKQHAQISTGGKQDILVFFLHRCNINSFQPKIQIKRLPFSH